MDTQQPAEGTEPVWGAPPPAAPAGAPQPKRWSAGKTAAVVAVAAVVAAGGGYGISKLAGSTANAATQGGPGGGFGAGGGGGMGGGRGGGMGGLFSALHGDFTVSDNFDTNFFGSITLASGDTPLRQPTDAGAAGSPQAQAAAADNAARMVTLDDGSSVSFSPTGANANTPLPWLTPTTPVSVGTRVTFHAPVILDWRFSLWNFQPQQQVTGDGSAIATFSDTRAGNQQPTAVGGTVHLATFNVENFFPMTGQAYVVGLVVNCPESASTVMTDLREIGPTYYFAPPRVLENLITQVMIRMEDAGILKRKLFHAFMAHARKVGPELIDGRPVGLVDRLLHRLGDLIVYEPLKNTLGMSRVRVAYTAGEAVGPEIFNFFRALGVNMKQLYGQTEASVFVTIHPNGEVYSDTVGKPVSEVELRIADTGEVLYRSPGVFKEYFKNPQATNDTKTADGWVHTGDAGYLDDRGHLRIIDRARDVGKLNDGTLFAPKFIENKLKFFPHINEAVAFGHGRDFVTAFVNIDMTAVGDWAERRNIAYASYQELAGHGAVYDLIEQEIERVNRDLANDPRMAGAQIRRFLILHKALEADDGELTRTNKVRRGFIGERYKSLVDALYSGASDTHIKVDVTFEDGRKGTIEGTVAIRDLAPQAAAPLRKTG